MNQGLSNINQFHCLFLYLFFQYIYLLPKLFNQLQLLHYIQRLTNIPT